MRHYIIPAFAGFVTLSLLPAMVHAQGTRRPGTGPVIEAYGPVFDVPAIGIPVETDREYRAVFDVAESPEAKNELNRAIETVARFLNMHARAGVPLENMKLALVLHGGAGKDALADGPYRARYGVDNPNRELIDQLWAAGVEIVLCGQTAASRGLPRGELNPSVRLALSAMTALVTYQADGYALIAF